MLTHQQSRVESSPTSLAESGFLMPQASFSSVGLQRSGVRVAVMCWEANVEFFTGALFKVY